MALTAVVTGGTGGIGRWIALGLAQAGFRVVLVGRNLQSGDAARRWIDSQRPGADLVFAQADLSRVVETAALGHRLAAEYPAVTLLVNNAGVFQTRRHPTPDGFDEVLAVNFLAPFILSRALEPSLRSGAPSRIVTVGSSTSDRARLDPAAIGAPQPWRMVQAYAQSKLAVMMATFAWARRLDGSGIVANVVHPGMVATGLVRAPGVIGLAWRLMAPWIRTEQQGAATPLHVALAPEHARTTGLYFKDRAPVPPNRLARDPVLCERVWARAEQLTTQ